MWVAMAQFIDLYISPAGGAINEGYAHWEAVTIGGQTENGYDATNELSYLFLQSKREFPTHYPDLAARVHTRSPERFLAEIAETIKEGSGFPKLINDEEVVPLLLSKGATFEEALDYAVSGCAEARMPNRDTYTSGCAYINFAAALEMTLYSGKMKKYGDEQIGLQTGDPRSFKTWEEFYNAYLAHQTDFIKQAFIQQHHIIRLRAQHFAVPLASALHDLCMESCLDLHQPKIPGGIDMGYFEFIGYGTVVDSLSAIKKLVFEEKKLTMSEILDAVQNNFEGKEDVRQMLMNVPCYGNNDPYADGIAKGSRPGRGRVHSQVFQGTRCAPRPAVRALHLARSLRQGRQRHPERAQGLDPALRRFFGISRCRQERADRGPVVQLHHQEPRLPGTGGAAVEHQVHSQVRGRRGGDRQTRLLHPHLVRPETLARPVQHHQPANPHCRPEKP